MACRVAITISAMLRRAFLFFREFGELTTPARGLYITPSRLSSVDAGKSAHRPMGTAALAWSLSVVGLRQWSRECYAKSIVILHKKQCSIKCLFRVYPIYTLHIAIYRIHFLMITTYSIFTAIAPVFPSLEVVKLLCVSLRSRRRFALAFRCSRLRLFRLERSNHTEC